MTNEYEPLMNTGALKQCPKPSPRETLLDSRRRLQEKLAELDEAIQFLDENPAFEKGMTLLNKALRY